jgi:hypothetical protein
MALLATTRGSQNVQASEFVFAFNDTMKDVNGVLKTFGSTIADLTATFEVIKLPPGAQIVGGDLVVEKQGVGPTGYAVSIGTSSSATAILASSSILAADNTRYPFPPASGASTAMLASNTGLDVRIAVAGTAAAATAGKVRVTLLWKLDGRTTESNV